MTSTTTHLNQIFRRLRHYQSEDEWVSAIRDGTEPFAGQVGIFTLREGRLRLRSQHGLNVTEALEFPASSAAAFAAATESKEPLVALRTGREVTEALSAADPAARAHLFPIANTGRIVAILFAAGESLDADALELLAGMAAAVLERQSNRSLQTQIGIAPPAVQNSKAHSSLQALSDEQREIHVKAKRFSRVCVAEMQLARPEACRAGQEQKNVYMFLQREIDGARHTYQKQFMATRGMLDYLHFELVERVAGGNANRLGADYPGKLD